MGTATQMPQSEKLARFRREAKVMGCENAAWLDRLGSELEKLPSGTIIVINCENGEYVSGETHMDALHRFRRDYQNARGWMHEIGGGFFIGGGIV